MSGGIDYCRDRASDAEIAVHLRACDEGFSPRLSGRVDIKEYAHKISAKAHRFEAWVNGDLAGLVAVYCNAPDMNTAFITSVSVLPHWQGRSIASRLMEDCIAHVSGLGFARLELEVGGNNQAAIALYEKHGFAVMGQSAPLLKMTLDL